MNNRDPEGRDSGQEPDDEPDPAEELRRDRQKASGAGICIAPVKKPIVPEEPLPPNQPNIFCEPCAKKTIPSTSRRIVVAALSSVANSRRSILTF
jgi:hypothetical protein